MAHPHAPSLRARLAGLVAAAMLPAVVLAVALGAVQHGREQRAAEEQVLRLARASAARQAQLLAGTERLLRGLLQVPQVRAGGRACDAFLHGLLAAFPDYANVGTQRDDGVITCNGYAPGTTRRSNTPEEVALVQRAGHFLVGDYAWGAIVQRPVLPAWMPVARDSVGRARGEPALVYATLDMRFLERSMREAGLPPGATVSIVDTTGRVSIRFPDPARFRDVRLPEFAQIRPLLGHGEFVRRTVGRDGVERLFGVVPLDAAGARGKYLAVGVPTAALAPATARFRRELLLLVGLFGAGVVVAWLVGDRVLLRPAARIAEACDRLGRGDLGARTGLRQDGSELGRIAGSFDRMAIALERRQAEAERTLGALEASEARFRTLAEHAPVGVTLSSADGIVWVNPQCVEITGRSLDALRGRGWLDTLHPDDRALVEAELRAVRDGALPFLAGEYRIRRPDGTVRWVEAQAVPVRVTPDSLDGAGADEASADAHVGYVGVVHDVTDRRAAEAQRRQAQRLEAVGRLAGGVAHDFNNLLMVVGGNADLALEEARQGAGGGDELVEVLGEIRAAARRGADVTRQLLAFSGQQVLRPRPLDLSDVARDGLRLLRRLAGEDLRLDAELAPQAGPVLADATQLDQVLFNLVINARDALRGAACREPPPREPPQRELPGREPRVVVATMVEEVAGPALGARWADPPLGPAAGPPPGRYAVLAVRDNGPGMDEATRARVFEPFFTTKPVGAGTGLGLATVYGVVAQSGGHVTVESAPGAGSVFRVYLPLLPGGADAPAPPGAPPGAAPDDVPNTTPNAVANASPDTVAAAPAGSAAPARAATVLLAEDDAAVRALLRRALERAGLRVLEAADGAEAWALWEAAGGAVDAVVSDVVMPGLGGPALLARVRRARPGVPVLLMSGYADAERGARPAAEGDAAPDARLDKPVAGDALAERVRALLGLTPGGGAPNE